MSLVIINRNNTDINMAIIAGMAKLDVRVIMVWVTSIGSISTFSLVAPVAALPEPNCSDSCNGQGGCNGRRGCNGSMAVMAKMVLMVVMAIMAFLITWTCVKGLES